MDTLHLLFARRAARAAFALSLVSALAACGDEDDNNPPDDGDTSTDVSGDATGEDAGDDATPDVGIDTTPDVGEDTTPDIGVDTTPDIGVDTTPDVGEDTTPDVGADTADVGTDTADVGTDTADVGADTADVGTDTADVGTDTADVGTDTADVGTDTATDVAMDGDTGVVDDPGLVFGDDYAPGVSFAPFGGSVNSLTVDMAESAVGDASLRIEVPAAGYTGGALVGSAPWDVSTFNAITFSARASQAATLNVAGLGNDSAATTWQVEVRGSISLGTEWATYTIPLPDPADATVLAGLFHFAEGADEGAYTMWLDDIRYVELNSERLSAPAAAFGTTDVRLSPGQTTTAPGLVANFTANGAEVQTFPTAAWFEWESSSEATATVDEFGVVTALAEGEAVVTATLGGEPVGGELTIGVVPGPSAGPAAPTTRPEEVLACLFSDTYPTDPVNTFLTEWSAASLIELALSDNNLLLYSNLDVAGISVEGDNSIDLTSATTMHIDLWTANATLLGIKLVDFGPDNTFGTGDEAEATVNLTRMSVPGFALGRWARLDIPMTSFRDAGLESQANISQILLVGEVDGTPGIASVYVDNIYFY